MVTGWPLMPISPESAGWAPESVCIRVDFPAPLPPTTATTAGVEVDADVFDGVDAAEGHADVAEARTSVGARGDGASG